MKSLHQNMTPAELQVALVVAERIVEELGELCDEYATKNHVLNDHADDLEDLVEKRLKALNVGAVLYRELEAKLRTVTNERDALLERR